MTSNSASRVMVVTGANRGIGYGIVRRAAAEYRKSDAYAQSAKPLKIYLTARDEEKGREAVKSIKAELQAEDLRLTTIDYHQLDLSDADSKDAILTFLQRSEGGLDLL